MNYRIDEHRTTMHFLTCVDMPLLVHEACLATDTPSNTRYMQEAICRRLAADLHLDLDELLAKLPPGRAQSRIIGGQRAIGSANTVEEVR